MPLRLREFMQLAASLVFCTAASVAPAVEVEPTFTMRRVTPPAKDETRFITIQIERVKPPVPDAVEEVLDAALDLEPLGPILPAAPSADSELNLFWTQIQGQRGPQRLAAAAAVLETMRFSGGSVPRAGIRRLGQRYGAQIAEAVRGTPVSPALVLAVMMVESSGRSDAVSRAGAAGLMQLMPATAERFGVRDRFDAAQSLRGGVAYLDWLLREFDGDVILALAGYNAGENAVKRHGGVPPYAETRAYVPKVVSAWRIASELCTTRQLAATDRCEWDRYALATP